MSHQETWREPITCTSTSAFDSTKPLHGADEGSRLQQGECENGTHIGVIKQYKSMVILRDLPYNSAVGNTMTPVQDVRNKDLQP